MSDTFRSIVIPIDDKCFSKKDGSGETLQLIDMGPDDGMVLKIHSYKTEKDIVYNLSAGKLGDMRKFLEAAEQSWATQKSQREQVEERKGGKQ